MFVKKKLKNALRKLETLRKELIINKWLYKGKSAFYDDVLY